MRKIIGMMALAWVSGPALADVAFEELSGAGIEAYTMAQGLIGGMAAADFDGDGDIDLFVPNAMGVADQLYENQGAGSFNERAALAGVAGMDNSRAALWVDVDADRDLDLIVVADRRLMRNVPQTHTFTLYEQVAVGVFTDATVGSGLDVLIHDPMDFSFSGGNHLGGMAAGDLNGDGWPDLVVTYWDIIGLTHVFMNDGDGTYTDVTTTCGTGSATGNHWQPVIHDFNGDGAADIYAAVDFGTNRLWQNDGSGTFVDVAAAAQADNLMNDMGVALGDYNGDGRVDIFVTNIHDPFNDPSDYAGRHNVLLRNDSAGGIASFTEVSEAVGVDKGDWGWGVTFCDADRDGRLDIAQTNGMNRPGFETDRSRLFRQADGSPLVFEEIGLTCGVDDTDRGASMLALDLDRDGDLDLAQNCNGGPVRLRGNISAPAASWLVVRPRMCGPNTHALGAVVRAKIGADRQTRVIQAGMSSMGQEPAEAHFGLGSATSVDTLTIEWPDGTTIALLGVGVDQVITVAPGCDGDIDKDCDVDVFDFAQLAAGFGQAVPAHADVDLTGDGLVNVFDFAQLAADFGCVTP